LLGCLKRVVEHAAAARTGIDPPLAAQSVGKLGVVPSRDVVVGRGHVLAQKSLVEIARVVEHKDDWPQPMPTELADLLNGHLARTFAGDQDQPKTRSTDRGAENRRGRPPTRVFVWFSCPAG